MEEVKSAARLTTYLWVGTNETGTRIQGELAATTPSMARAELRCQGITPVKIKKKSATLFKFKQKMLTADITLFSRQMATMLNAGIPLPQALSVCSRGHKKHQMQALINMLVQDVQAGSSFSAALQKNPQQFDSLFCNLIYAGEQSGCLELMLENIAVYKERLESLKSKVKKALIYPVAVIAIALIITVILLLFVVPQFKAIFQSFGAPLPALTCAVIAISDFIFHYGWLLLLIAFTGFIGLLHYWKRSEKFRLAFDKAQLKIPIIGQILTKAAIARFARTLSITFAAGLPLADALLSVAGTTGNLLYQQATGKIQAEVATGQQLGRAMQLTQLFPTMTLQMVTIGEESGTLDKMLAKVADFYEAEVNNAVDSLSSLLEPMIMVILGVLIGSLVVALYLPIFKLGSVIG